MKPMIVVPYDFSAASRNALAWAAELHRATGGPPIRLIHTIDPLAGGTPEMLAVTIPTEDELRKFEALLAEAAVEEHVEATAQILVRSGSPGAVILEAVREIGCDLIVMGTHGRTGVRRLLLGSVAEHVVRHAHCPVVTVRGPQHADRLNAHLASAEADAGSGA
jgi:universal stress protein A